MHHIEPMASDVFTVLETSTGRLRTSDSELQLPILARNSRSLQPHRVDVVAWMA